MGSGYTFDCKKCGHRFTHFDGIGFLFFQEAEKVLSDIRSGKYGEEWKLFLKEHPEGRVNCAKALQVCKDCHIPRTDLDLSLYLPKDSRSEDEPYEDDEYVMPRVLEEDYTLYAVYPHKCEKCGGDCTIVTEKMLTSRKDPGLVCPECGGPMKKSPDKILWD